MISFKTFLISSLLMLIAFIFVHGMASRSGIVVVEKKLDKFPYQIENISGVDIEMEDVVVRELNADVYIFRKYFNKNGVKISLYIGYYGTGKGGRTGHNPYACYPGSGWAIVDQSKVKVPVVLNGKERIITLNFLCVKKQNIRELVYHWYQSNGDEVLTTGLEQNLHRFKSMLLYNRNDGAFVRVSTPLVQSMRYTQDQLQDFTRKIFPLIVSHWPVEKEI